MQGFCRHRITVRVIGIMLMLTAFGTGPCAQSRTLQYNRGGERMNGRDVELLQKHLLYHGYDMSHFGVDGWFGPVTEAALIAYQRDRGMEPTGRITVAELGAALPWNPYHERLERTAALPERGRQEEIVLSDGKVVETYYGRLRIQRDPFDQTFIFRIDTESAPIELGRTRDQTMLRSPTGRFFAYEFPVYDDGRGRDSHIAIIDLLTERTRRIHAAEMVQSTELSTNPDTPFQEFYWTRHEQLLIRLYPPEGSYLVTVTE